MNEVLELQIHTGSAVPIFRQIVEQVRLAVARGVVSEGDPLPSVRALAEKLVLNPNTIARAYSELARDGVIETQPGKGAFVAKQRQVYTKTEKLRRLSPAIEAMINHAIGTGLTAPEIREAVTRKLDEMGL